MTPWWSLFHKPVWGHFLELWQRSFSHKQIPVLLLGLHPLSFPVKLSLQLQAHFLVCPPHSGNCAGRHSSALGDYLCNLNQLQQNQRKISQQGESNSLHRPPAVFAVLEGLFGRCLITAPVVTLSHTKAGETDSWWFILLNMTDGSSYK